MNSLFEFMRRFAEGLVWWTIIQPWEEALRVRLGSRVRKLPPGIHFKIPYADAIYRQSVRLRYCMMGVQTVTTLDGKTITLMATIGYTISSVEKLYGTLHHAEETIRQLSMSEVARFIQERPLLTCRPADIEKAVSSSIDLTKYGLLTDGIRITDFAVVRTYRLITDLRYGTGSDMLDTGRKDTTIGGGSPA
jgi:regulator of protease activity HflC (stomatin/prohibitin superfamily)